jgi:class 3 adenylate cyclase/tetratricopeptide (TPR) repeat protein
VLCSKCGIENPDGAKFCIECATPFSRKCPSCGAENPPRAKFCAQCSTAIDAPKAASSAALRPDHPAVRVTGEIDSASADGERKTVTALFADIKGSMDLMEDLDPEEARAIVDPAFKLMIDAAHHYDGYIVQSTGDGIFALFGAPVAHEDHPQRALFAALRIQEEMRRYSTKLREAGNPPLEARIGVNTGETVVRSIKTGDAHTEYTPIGHSTSLASRMQTLAPTGSIAVTETTQKFCAGYFSFKALGPTRVKGVTEPVKVFEVTGLGPLRTRLQRSAGRGLTKFVGREREMEALRHAAGLACEGRGQIAAAMAEAGTGKSRLFFEFKATSQSGWMVLETFSVSHGKASAYMPVIDLLQSYFKIVGEDDQRTRRAKVTGNVLTLDRSFEDTLPYLFALLGIVEGEDPLSGMDPQIRKRRTLEAIKRILLRESLNQPLMVIFEDLHWIDDETQSLLNLLADSIGTVRLLLLVNYRPEYSHQWNSKTYYTQLRLDPLGTESAEEMLTAMIGDGAEVRPLRRLIIERTGGNPFFMEETVQVLRDEGALVRDGAAVRLTKPLSELKIPPTVQAILAARIDRLPADEKDLLQALAVMGKEFKLSLVIAVTAKSDDELAPMLDNLQLAEFIYEQPAIGDIEYSFKHALTQEVAFGSLLNERRKLLHERVGAAIEALYSAKLDDHFGELARHYSQSRNKAKAIEYLQMAGQQAAQRSAYAEAVGLLTTGLELLKSVPDEPERQRRELEFQLYLARSLRWTKGIGSSENERALVRARELCEMLDNRTELFAILQGLESHHIIRLNLGTARGMTEQLVTLATEADDPAKLMVAHGAWAQVLMQLGEFAEARKHFEQASPYLDWRLNDTVSVFYPGLGGWTLWALGYPDQALKWNRAAIALAETLSRPALVANVLSMTAVLGVLLRNHQMAQANADAAIAIGTENSFSFELAFAIQARGWALAQQGQADEGIAEMRRAISDLEATGFVRRTRDYAFLAEVCAANQGPEVGLGIVAEGMAVASKTGERSNEAELHRLRGELLLQQNASNGREAEQCFRTAIQVAQLQSAKSLELRATMGLARLLAKQDHRDEARAMLVEIYNWFTEGFDTADLKNAKALLDELGSA